MYHRILAVICTVLTVSAASSAATYYVAYSGSNSNPGTFIRPWCTIDYAASSSSGVCAGDTIVVRGGNYPEIVSPEVSGTQDMPIVLKNYAFETVTLDPGGFHFFDGVNYWEIRNMQALHSNNNGLRVTGTHEQDCLLAKNCVFSHHKENGVSLGGPNFGSVTISRCTIESNGEMNGHPSGIEGSGIVMYGSRGRLHAFGNQIANNWAKGIAHGSEVDFQGDGSVIEGNQIINNYETGMDWLADNSYIVQNYFAWNGVRDDEAGEWGDTGLSLASVASGNLIAFNVIKSSGQMELSVRGANNLVYNNTIIKDHYYTTVPGSPYAAAIILFDTNQPDNEFRNNVIINLCSQAQHHFAVIAEDYLRYLEQTWSNNLYWCPYSTSTPPTNRPFKLYNCPAGNYLRLSDIQQVYPQQERGSLYSDPQFMCYRDSLYTRRSASPAIDEGLAVGFPFVGAAPDIGRFEYSGIGSPGDVMQYSPAGTPNGHDLSWLPEGLRSAVCGAIWRIVEVDQIVHADSFRVHLQDVILPPGFASFQMRGGVYEEWRDTPISDEFVFPLIPDSENLLQLRIRFQDGSFGPAISLLITEDSTPPAPPEGIRVRSITPVDTLGENDSR
ncbi:MAG: right-handed parallel beta-helix repeat-containing protein [bacterium]